jgi:signal transduction histidine kinase/ligand-binding sensor domain-containing protein
MPRVIRHVPEEVRFFELEASFEKANLKVRAQKDKLSSVRAIAIAALACSVCLFAELLPIRTYTIADGLAADQIFRIVPDSRGFLWFCTPEGLSRFDGHRIVSFGVEQGLPHRTVETFLETHAGEYFVGTPRGLSQFRSGAGNDQFVTYHPGSSPAENDVSALFESSSGKIWIGTSAALFEMMPGFKFRKQPLPEPLDGWDNINVDDIVEDKCGKLWLATTSGIDIVDKDGAVQRLTERDGLPSNFANTLFKGKDGKLWAGMRGGLVLLRDGCDASGPGVERAHKNLGPNVTAIAEGSDGALWVSTYTGLRRLLPDGTLSPQLTRANGLADRVVFSLASDKAGNIWAGTEGAGAMSIQPTGFMTFSDRDGLRTDRVWSVFGDQAEKMVAITGSEDQTTWVLNVFDGAAFHSVPAPKVFADQRTWGSNRILIQSRTGAWWGASSKGLCRYAAVTVEKLSGRAPEQCYAQDKVIFQIFEDSKSRIWAGAQSPQGDRLLRWDPATNAVITFDDLPKRSTLAKSFAEDRHGNIWIGQWASSVFRYDGQRFTSFTTADGVPAGTIFSMLVDSSGRLWMGARSGLAVVDDPGAAAFHARTYNQSNGLFNNTVHAILEDRQGFIYAATGAGVDRLNPATGRFKHFSAADGFARGEVESAFRDKDGNLWFATTQGLSRLVPAESPAPRNPSVLITGLQTGGSSYPVSQRGADAISRIELDPSSNQLQVEFVAFSDEPEANLRYAYKLEGSGSDWSVPRSQHVVNYAALASGDYRFLVKAINSDGLESATPAVVQFTVLPPFWRRWWFEALALAALTSIVYFLHRYRVAQIVGLERMRTAIATDLHDDIGASLSQIAILSEVARAGVSQDDRLPQESLQKVATLARELVDSMSDIVWSIRAQPEGLDSLVRRMREFALDVLVSQGVDFELRAPHAVENMHLGLDMRRQLLLMFKECVHNVARHSGCTIVTAQLSVAEREIMLTVEDNGKGLEASKGSNGGGNGIPGMLRRAESLGGSVQFTSKPGQGCLVSIRLPVRRSDLVKDRA